MGDKMPMKLLILSTCDEMKNADKPIKCILKLRILPKLPCNQKLNQSCVFLKIAYYSKIAVKSISKTKSADEPIKCG